MTAISKRTHRKKIEADRSARHISPEKIRQEKNLRSKARTAEFKRARSEEASSRQKAWGTLTPAQQLAVLDKRLGKGVGAQKQRRKIKEKLNG